MTVRDDGKGQTAGRTAGAGSHTDSSESFNAGSKDAAVNKDQPTIWSPERKQPTEGHGDHIVVQREWAVSEGARDSSGGQVRQPWDKVPEKQKRGSMSRR